MKNIHFTEEDFNVLKSLLERDDLDDNYDKSTLGTIDIGAINCELIFKPYCGNEDDPYTYGPCNSILDCNFFLLGENSGYAETEEGVPYGYEEGFHVEIKDTYEETLNKLLADIDEHIKNNERLLKMLEFTDLTWDDLISIQAIKKQY